MSEGDLENVHFGPDGLIPVVAQDIVSGDVLMLAFMNREALARTRQTGRAHYWSRSRQSLWQKGETSGNVQVVEEILINCEQNSLLLKVRQQGAVCHEGFDTCYFRTLNDDGSLAVVREQSFDPATVYGTASQANISAENDPLHAATKLQFGAYVYLRDHHLESESGTSRRLRQPGVELRSRVADELEELAGVFSAEHRHSEDDFASDVRLETSQVIYWLLLTEIRAGTTWQQLRPDRALATADEPLPAATTAKLLRAEAGNWRKPAAEWPDSTPLAHATLALVGQAGKSGGVDPLAAVEMDIEELRSRPYLTGYFATHAPSSPAPSIEQEGTTVGAGLTRQEDDAARK